MKSETVLTCNGVDVINTYDRVIISGDAKTGKSTFASALAFALSAATPAGRELFCFKAPRQRKVLYLGAKDQNFYFADRGSHSLIMSSMNMKLEDNESIDGLVEYMIDMKVEVLILDSLANFHDTDEKEERQTMLNLTDKIGDIIMNKTKACVIFIHERDVQEEYCIGDFYTAMNSEVIFRMKKFIVGGTMYSRAEVTRSRGFYEGDVPQIHFSMNEGAIHDISTHINTLSIPDRLLLELSGKPLSDADIFESVPAPSFNAITTAKNSLVSAGLVAQTGRGKRKRYGLVDKI